MTIKCSVPTNFVNGFYEKKMVEINFGGKEILTFYVNKLNGMNRKQPFAFKVETIRKPECASSKSSKDNIHLRQYHLVLWHFSNYFPLFSNTTFITKLIHQLSLKIYPIYHKWQRTILFDGGGAGGNGDIVFSNHFSMLRQGWQW